MSNYDHNDDNVPASRPHPIVPGYAAVLVRIEAKNAMRALRDRMGLLRESQVERCLATALFDLALNDPSLVDRLLMLYEARAEEDPLVTRVPLPPRAQGSTPSPQPGTVSRKCG
jgi:hypothetical protein